MHDVKREPKNRPAHHLCKVQVLFLRDLNMNMNTPRGGLFGVSAWISASSSVQFRFLVEEVELNNHLPPATLRMDKVTESTK